MVEGRAAGAPGRDGAGTTRQRLESCLSGLAGTAGVEGSAIVTRDGLLIASESLRGTDPEVFAAMAATMVGAAENALLGLAKGSARRVIVEAPRGTLVATGAGPSAVLVVLACPGSGLGAVLVEAGRAAELVQGVL